MQFVFLHIDAQVIFNWIFFHYNLLFSEDLCVGGVEQATIGNRSHKVSRVPHPKEGEVAVHLGNMQTSKVLNPISCLGGHHAISQYQICPAL